MGLRVRTFHMWVGDQYKAT